jgi:acetamidase/formamidase
MTHEIPLERRTLHGHFSRDLEPILTIDSGESVAFSCLDSGWHVAPGEEFEPRDEDLDSGHALVGPIEVRGARAGQTLAVRIDEVRVGSFGATVAGGWSTPLNDRLGMSDGETLVLHWSLDAEAGIGRDAKGREVELRPFPGVLGMPPPEAGVHPTAPPRRWGGNIDCTELVAGTTFPSSTRMLVTIPAAGEGISTVVLSVWISTSGSSSAISCPSETSQRAISPSVSPSPRSGSLNS